MTVIAVYIIAFPLMVNSIWPPPYKVDFKHEEEFVISENDEDDEADEMLKQKDIKRFNLQNDEKKYSRLHKLIKNYNKVYSGYNPGLIRKPKEFIPDIADPHPWHAGFINLRKSLRVDSSSVKYGKDEERKAGSSYDDYNYDDLKLEYEMNVKKEEKSKNVLNFTEIKGEETVKEAVDALVHSPRKNCTVEEQKGIGITALKCLFNDLVNPDTTLQERLKVVGRIKAIIIIWLSVYLIIAVPCWCQRGWCCCCFRCKFCRPREDIDKAKKYLAENPLGVYHISTDEVVNYKPSNYEKYAHKNLERALLKL